MRQKTLRLKPSKSIGAPIDSSTADLPVYFKLRGTQAHVNYMGLPMVTSQKFIVLHGSHSEADRDQEYEGATFLKLLYVDTSATFVRPATTRG